MQAAAAAQRGGNVRFAALDLQHGRLERDLKDAFARLTGSSALTLGVELDRTLPVHPDPRHDEIERVADSVHAAVRIPNARSGANRC
jgi:hypothetical protein